MITREDAFGRIGTFWSDLCQSITLGVRDLDSGFDRVSFDYLDTRVEGGGTLDFVLARALAHIWRVPEKAVSMSVLVMTGTFCCGALNVKELGLDSWHELTGLHFSSDGPIGVASRQSMSRRLRLDQGSETLEKLFGTREIPGDLTVTVGLLGEPDTVLSKAAAQIVGTEEVSQAGVLFLYEPNPGPVDIEDAGGWFRNGWHPSLMASQSMSNSHLSSSYAQLMQLDQCENWYEDTYRKAVFDGLEKGLREYEVALSKRGFLDSLAEGSPLRKVLPHHLTRYFPEAERLFWCLPDGIYADVDPVIWDECSPFERLAILSRVKTSFAPIEG